MDGDEALGDADRPGLPWRHGLLQKEPDFLVLGKLHQGLPDTIGLLDLSGALAARMHSAHAMTVSRGDTNLMLHSFAAKLANGGSDESKAYFDPSQDG